MPERALMNHEVSDQGPRAPLTTIVHKSDIKSVIVPNFIDHSAVFRPAFLT